MFINISPVINSCIKKLGFKNKFVSSQNFLYYIHMLKFLFKNKSKRIIHYFKKIKIKPGI